MKIQTFISRIRKPGSGSQELKPMRYLCRNTEEFHYDEEKFYWKGVRTELVPPIFEKLRRYSRPEAILEGNYCYTGLSQMYFHEILTEFGICYTFNINLEILNRETLVYDKFEVKLKTKLIFLSLKCVRRFFENLQVESQMQKP